MPSLLWFRRDLRLGDHPALLAAAENDEVLACFVLDPRLEASSGPRRLQYLGDALRQLQDDLDGRLLVTRGRPEKQIPLIANAIEASAVRLARSALLAVSAAAPRADAPSLWWRKNSQLHPALRSRLTPSAAT